MRNRALSVAHDMAITDEIFKLLEERKSPNLNRDREDAEEEEASDNAEEDEAEDVEHSCLELRFFREGPVAESTDFAIRHAAPYLKSLPRILV